MNESRKQSHWKTQLVTPGLRIGARRVWPRAISAGGQAATGGAAAAGQQVHVGILSDAARLLVVDGEPFGEGRRPQARVRTGSDRNVRQFGTEVAGMLLAHDRARVVVGGQEVANQVGELYGLRPGDLNDTVDRVGQRDLHHSTRPVPATARLEI